MRRFSVVVLSILALTACSKKKLSDEHKDKIVGVLSDVGTVASSGKANGGADTLRGAVNTGVSSSLHQKIKAGNCTINIPSTNNEKSSSPLFSQDMTISGASCPVGMNFNMSVTQTGARQTISATYSSSNPDFIAASKMRSFNFNGYAEMSASKIDVDFTATIDSVTHGKVDISTRIDVDFNKRIGYVDVKIAVPDFKIEMHAEANGDQEKYTINGEEVGREDAREVLNLVGTF